MFAKNFNEMQIIEHNKMKDLEKLERQIQNEERLRDVFLIISIYLFILSKILVKRI